MNKVKAHLKVPAAKPPPVVTVGHQKSLIPRLVATDADGTIVRTDGTISPRTVAALRRVERAGSSWVLATGRPPRWISPIAKAVGGRGLAICANGALLYDMGVRSVVEASYIGRTELIEVICQLRAALPEIRFAAEYADGFGFETNYDLGGWDPASMKATRVDSAELLGVRPVAKLLARHPSLDANELVRYAVQEVGEIVEPTRSNGPLLEMTASGISKASTLARLCDRWLIDASEVLAFGDMPNDLPMLQWAGISYAMANAHPDVLAATENRAESNDADGVAKILELSF